MRLARKLHLYTGVFFAPGIIFLALSGFFQSLGWHEEHDGKPPLGWVATISEVHKDQRLPAPRPAIAPNSTSAPTATPASTAPSSPASTPITTPATTGGISPPSNPATNAQASAPLSANAQASPGKAGAPARRPRKKSFPLQLFMSLLAMSLIGSTLVGLWMAFQVQRNTAFILGLLIAGTLIPIAALYAGIQ